LEHLKKILYWTVQYSVLRNAMTVFFATQTEQDLAKTSFWTNEWNTMVIPYGIHNPVHLRSCRISLSD
jgi:hypothetical protein